MEYIRHLFHKAKALPRFVVVSFFGTLLAILLLYYPLGMIIMHRIDDDTHFVASDNFDIAGGSHTVAMMQSLIQRETWKNHWSPNDPFFYPSHYLVRMPAFQRGIISALSRFAVELSDQIGRTRSSSQIDPDLEKAAGLLKYSPNVWVFDFSTSLLPTASSEEQYLTAVKLLGNYNLRLAKGEAIFDRRADNLIETLECINTDLGSASAIIETHVKDAPLHWIDRDAGDIFYNVKGKMYADYLLLRELKRDFSDIIKEKQLEAVWDTALESLQEGAGLGHFFILNASTQSQFLPNHLAIQGFYLMRARIQIRSITGILVK